METDLSVSPTPELDVERRVDDVRAHLSDELLGQLLREARSEYGAEADRQAAQTTPTWLRQRTWNYLQTHRI